MYFRGYIELDDALGEATGEGGYVPTFNKAPRTSNNKTLLKNSSAKSIESSMSNLNPVPTGRTNMLQLHKDAKKEATTF